ncbi:MAG: nucleotide sugar dehydrogenase [bacterium]|nr:nucleotide sugar dehydrogenase [bacterium]
MRNVCVIGLGYVGLPLALLTAEKGYIVYGLENNSTKAKDLAEKHTNIFINHLDALLSDVIIVAVPTPVDESKNPDLSLVRVACEQIAERLTSKGQLIILESTVNPFISRKYVLPILEKNGLLEGRDFFLAHCPERIDPGNAKWNVSNIPRVVGALCPEGLEKVKSFYQSILSAEVFSLSSIEAAEMTKIYENSLRAVNIAFANEMAIVMQNMKLDAKEIIGGVKTKPFGLDLCYPSCGVGGHCFDKEHIAFYVKDGFFSTATVQEIFEKFESEEWKDLQVLSFDLSTKETSYESVTHVSKRFSERIYSLRTAGGYILRVTDLHPVITFDKGDFLIKFAKDIKYGERMILSYSLPEISSSQSIDIIPYLKESQIAKIRVKLKEGSFQSYKSLLSSTISSKRRLSDTYLKYDYLPLAEYLRLEALLKIPRKNILLATGRGHSMRTFSAIICITKDLARLMGYYLSEGCITVDDSLRVRFTFHVDEKKYLSDVQQILSSFGVAFSIYRSKVDKAVTLKVSSELFGMLFRDVFKAGVDCYTMRVPLVFMNLSYREDLLSGILRGDGGVSYKNHARSYKKNEKWYVHNSNSIVVDYFTSSVVLFQQVSLLLLSLGVVPRMQKRKGLLRIYGKKNAEKLSPFFSDVKGQKLIEYLSKQKKDVVYSNIKDEGRFYSLEIEEVKEEIYNDYVYSLEIDKTHTLVVDNGLVVHNCIPVDPFYLIDESLKRGFDPSFLRTAMRVNGYMPNYTVSLLSSALNEVGKSVKGTKVGILGVAYKKNVDDLRESPALEIIKRIKSLGADLKVYDPFIPEYSNATKEEVLACDAVLLLTDHSEFLEYDFSCVPVLIDGKNVLDKSKIQGVYKGIGR